MLIEFFPNLHRSVFESSVSSVSPTSSTSTSPSIRAPPSWPRNLGQAFQTSGEVAPSGPWRGFFGPSRTRRSLGSTGQGRCSRLTRDPATQSELKSEANLSVSSFLLLTVTSKHLVRMIQVGHLMEDHLGTCPMIGQGTLALILKGGSISTVDLLVLTG